MEKRSAHKINFLYESELYNIPIKNSLASDLEELEYIYFLLNETSIPLLSKSEYSSTYFKYLQSLGFPEPKVTREAEAVIPWWGNFIERDKKKLLNSKAEFIKLLKSLDIKTTQRVVKPCDIEPMKQVKKFYLKNNYGMSAKGNFLIANAATLNKFAKIKEEMVFSPFLNAIVELSLVFINRGCIEINIPFYKNGLFQGGLVFSSQKELEKYLSENYRYNWSETLEIIQHDLLLIEKSLEKKLDNNIEYPFSVDALLYESNNSLEIEYLEMNYRKSMGLLLIKMRELLRGKQGKLIIGDSGLKGLILSPAKSRFKMQFIE